MPRINLLPWREQQRRERRLGFYAALGTAAAVAAVAAFATYLLFGSLIDRQEARNARLHAEIRLLDRQIEEINDLEQQKQNFISRMQIIEMLQAAGSKVVLAGMTLPPNYGPDYIKPFQQVYVELAAKYKVTRIPFLLSDVALHADLMQQDRIHPTAEGNEIVAKTVMKYLKPLLK